MKSPRALAASVALLVFAVAAAIGWHQSRSYEARLREMELAKVQQQISALGGSLAAEISRRQGLLAGLAAFTETHGNESGVRAAFENFAQGVQSSDPVIRAVQLFPRMGRNFIHPEKGNEAVLELTFQELLNDTRAGSRGDVQRMIETRQTSVSDPFELFQGGVGMVIRRAVFQRGELWGVAAVVVNVEPLLQAAGFSLLRSQQIQIACRDSTDTLFAGNASVFADSPANHQVALPDRAWTLAAVPTGGWSRSYEHAVSTFRLSAFLIAALLALVGHRLTRRLLWLARAVEVKTRELGAKELDYRRLFEASEQARVQLAEMLERISDGFATLDRNWRYTFANEKLAQLVGRSREDMMGQLIWSLFPEAKGMPVHEASHPAMAEQKSVELEHYHPPLRRWLQHRFYPSATGLSVFSRDITARKEAEELARANVDQLREMLRHLPIPVCYATGDRIIRYTNDRFTRLFGYTAENVPTVDEWWRLACPDPVHREQVMIVWEAANARTADNQDEVQPAEYRLTCKDGRVRRIEVSGISIRDGFLATFIDVTERREAEARALFSQQRTLELLEVAEQTRLSLLSVVEDQAAAQAALRANEERYRQLVDTSFDWVWEMDTQLRYTYSSARVKEFLGYEPEELMGKSAFDFMPEEEAGRMRRELGRIVEVRHPYSELERINLHRDGRQIVVESNGVPIFAPDGTWLGYRGMERDVTSRRAAEKTMRLHGAVLEAAANAVVITDPSGTIEWVNPAFTTLSGWTLADAVGKSPGSLVGSGKHGAAFYREMWETILEGRIWRGEITNRRKDGELRTEDVTITPLRDPGGRISHLIAIKLDITDQKRLEVHLLQSQRLESIGTLASGIAHDLNNILSPIMLVVGALQGKAASDEDKAMLDMAQTSARRGAAIVKQLLTFSRSQVGERVILQPRHIMMEMVHMMRETFPREIGIKLDATSELWTIVADPTQLHQILLNLCVNARDAMPGGGQLTLSARNATIAAGDPVLPPECRPGPYLALTVSDTGVGIPPEIKHRIFDPFFTTKELGKGTGLGLSTVFGIAQNHGGFITVDSAVKSGSVFRVYLPANPDGSAKAPATSGARLLPSPSGAMVGGRTVLLVEDESEIRNALRIMLENQKVRVITASNGVEALVSYFEHKADIGLVITDIMMPVMDGVAVVRTLRTINPALRFVVMSGMKEVSQRQELEELGVSDILSKPFELSAVLEMLDKLAALPR